MQMTPVLFLALFSIGIAITNAHSSIPQAEALEASTLEDVAKYLTPSQKHHQRHLNGIENEDSKPLLADYYGGIPGFYHGVASGDPLRDRVIVWTRFTPENADDEVDIELRMAEVDPKIPFDSHLDPSRNSALKRAIITVTGANDWIAKIDVTGLKSYTNYVFAFTDGVTSSIVGQTKTAPSAKADVESLVYAVYSCANFGNGYFHAYDIGSTISNLDFWVHLGDYVYEYGKFSTYASDSPERKNLIMPDWEQISLQDYRLRLATYSLDKGLENLRRRAPMIAIWDDHETTNNAYGQGSEESTGADNHQPVCPVNSTSPNSEKESAACDRDEGSASVRFLNAAQAYMEWMPIRKGPGQMGVVTTTSITQVIEWGSLATIVAFDTRISYRSKEPTLADAFAPFLPVAAMNTNYSSYSDPSSATYASLKDIATKAKKTNNDPKYTMIGENLGVLTDAFTKSKNSGKPWQIWAAATMLGPNKAINFARAAEVIEDPAKAMQFKGTFDFILKSTPVLRALVAMDTFDYPWNLDDFNGFGSERAAILNMVQTHANNAVILGGDLHDSWAWRLYDEGAMTGKAVAVNLGCPGVNSPGWRSSLRTLTPIIAGILGSNETAYKFLSDMWELQNEGLVYANVERKGFFAAKATRYSHTAEYFLIKPDTILTNFEAAREANMGAITAEFTCDASLRTPANMPGTLTQRSVCDVIEFDTERPAVWSLPVPIAPLFSGTKLTDCGMDSCVSALKKKNKKVKKEKTKKNKNKKRLLRPKA